MTNSGRFQRPAATGDQFPINTERRFGIVAGAALVVLVGSASARVLEPVQMLEESRLIGVNHVAITPDGRHAYVAADIGTSVLEHDLESGAFSFVETFGRILGGTDWSVGPTAISPDGANVYIVFHEDFHYSVRTTLEVYRRDADSGKLEFLEAHEEFLSDVSISPDGRHVYAVVADTLKIFSRDSLTGALTPARLWRANIGSSRRARWAGFSRSK